MSAFAYRVIMITIEALLAARDIVRAKNGAAGVDGVIAHDFSHADARALAKEVRNGIYVAMPARVVCIPKSDGDLRRISVLCVRDRVLHSAVAEYIKPRLDDALTPHSHAYRCGKSCRTARQSIASGDWLAFGDVASYFDSVRHDILLSAVETTFGSGVADIVALCLPEGRVGLYQGSPLSPALSNLYLNDFDRVMARRGGYARYSDNFAIAAQTESVALEALAHARDELSRVGLTMNGKSGVSPRSGFVFLGETL